jgi:hypothetical protein
MNIKIKKNLISFAIVFLLQLCFLPTTYAADEIEDEELPATDPFAGNASMTAQDPNMPSVSGNIINDMKLVGTVSGAHKKIAVLAMPDGRALKFEENEFATDSFQILEIYETFIVVRIDAKDEYEVFMNGQVNPREGN